MLEFRPLTPADVDTVRPMLGSNPNRLCDLTVGGIFIWRDYYKTEYAVHEGVLYFKVDYPGFGTAFAMPRGGDGKREYGQVQEYCERRDIPVIFYPMPKQELEGLTNLFPCASVLWDRDTFDYLYEAEALKYFKGKKLSGQRNHVNRFARTYGDEWSFAPLTAEDAADVEAFLTRYADATQKESTTFEEDLAKTREVLHTFAHYGMVGGVLRVRGAVVGFSIGEVVGDTLFIHIEKADRACEGGYQMLVSQFAQRYAVDGVDYINREDDTGDPGLRTSKLSYKPVALLEKYAVVVQDDPGPGRKGNWTVLEADIVRPDEKSLEDGTILLDKGEID